MNDYGQFALMPMTGKPRFHENDRASGYSHKAAWYVLSALGFYPVCSATDQYVLGGALFKKVTMQLENGKKIVINVPNNSAQNRYVNALRVNGKPHSHNWLSHQALTQGTTFDVDMTAKPNTQRGTQSGDALYLFSTRNP